LIAGNAYAQFDYAKNLMGLTLKTGLSYSHNDPVNTNRIPGNHLIAGWGLYRYFPVNKKNESFIPFHYLKVEAFSGFRSGLFTINDLNQTAVISTRYLELDIVAPLTWEVNDHLAVNVGAGAGIVWVGNQTINSDIILTAPIKEGNSLKGSFIFDYHFLFTGKSNAVLGSRILVESSQYAFTEWSIYFGFGFSHQKLKEKLKKKFNK
jgi:hypothetical protein